MKYEIPEEILVPVINYLASRPYRETHEAIKALGNLKKIINLDEANGQKEKQGRDKFRLVPAEKDQGNSGSNSQNQGGTKVEEAS